MNEEIDKNLKGLVTYGNVLYFALFIISIFLIVLFFCQYKYLFDTLHPSSCICEISCFMVP